MELTTETSEAVKIIGYLWRVSKDHEGEVTLQLRIPQIHQHYAMNLPEKTNFEISFKEVRE